MLFEYVFLHSRHLRNSDIDHLPSSGIRASLEVLDLSGTVNLKRFNAYESGVAFHNQTYPLLENVKFYYHAHCCQMQNHRFFHPPTTSNSKKSEKRSSDVRSTSNDIQGDINDLDGYICVNASNESEIFNTSSIVMFEKISAREFCSSVLCLSSICGDLCSPQSSQFSFSGSGISDVYCIPIVHSSCLDEFYNTTTISTEITQNTCTVPPTPSPSPSPSPPDPCADSEGWCENHMMHPEACETCIDTVCFDENCQVEFEELYMCYCSKKRRSTDTDRLQHQQPSQRFKHSTNSTLERDCVTEVICRVRLNRTEEISVQPTQLSKSSSYLPHIEPTSTLSASIVDSLLLPSPSGTAPSNELPMECEDLDKIGEKLLPSGWSYHPDSKETICMPAVSAVSPAVSTVIPTPTVEPINCTDHKDISKYVRAGLTQCSPTPDDFNPCEDLLGGNFLRAAIWFVIIFGVVGNGLVLFVFIVYAVIIRRTKVRFFPMHFLYANLAMADFLMAVYLLTLASFDAHTMGHFSEYDVEWRTGPGCGFSGFCAIVSTMVSVYTLVVITSERLYTITFVMRRQQITKLFAVVVMAFGWLFGIIMGMLPLVGVNRYDLVAVCLPFDTTSSSALTYIVFLLLLTGLAFIYIAISYGIIFYQVVLSPTKRKLVRSGGNSKQWKADLRMSIRMFILVITNFICWFPIALVSLTAAFGVPLHGINVPTAKIFVVFVFPLNACVNPFLYTLSTRVFKENFLLLLSKCGISCGTAKSAIHSWVFGPPSSLSARTAESSASRRSSVIQLLYSMHPFRRTSLDSDNNTGSNSNLRRPSQYSLGSNGENLYFMGRRSSTFSQNSNEDQNPIAAVNTNYRSSSPTREKTKHVLTSASSLEVLPEVDEVSDVPTSEPVVHLNPGYEDQNDSKFDEGSDNAHETLTHLGNGNLVNSALDGKEGVSIIINDNIVESSFSQAPIVANVLQIEGDSEEQSDTMSVLNDTHIHD